MSGADHYEWLLVPCCRAASADDYGVHPACIAAPAPASPNHKRSSSSSGHSHSMVSRALQAVKVGVPTAESQLLATHVLAGSSWVLIRSGSTV
jgi:hypothetical protein